MGNNLNMKILLDVDGTLTPSRCRIDPDFGVWFSEFIERNDVYIVTGSNKEKTVEQLGEDIYSKLKGAYQCSGNEHWVRDRLIRTTDFEYSPGLEDALKLELTVSKFYIRTGNHLEVRPGLLNFSVVGRNATTEQRKSYVEFDELHDERNTIAKHLMGKFPDYNFQVAGETGIDITKVGFGKEQVLTEFEKSAMILFIGDKTSKGGNDYEISQAVVARSGGSNSFAHGQGKFYNVEGWKDTWKILKAVE